ncbi:hypothetical protein ACFD7O_004459 [Vibrio vulnificus]|nr:hypothetical protein [Vibrio vulnificus]HDZ3700389.1 hypothetical protein [Vibrio vulnificus]HDZ3727821.1 hypothetical protein [Vibrio vulnificus]
MTNDELCRSIASVIANYRNGEFGDYDEAHVRRWVEQFDVDERRIVLKETNRIIKRNFISRLSFDNLVDAIISSKSVYGENKDDYWNSVSLLDIQRRGNSQKELNDIFCSKLSESYNIDNIINCESSEYLYIDDFIFSGGRVYSDLSFWLRDTMPDNCRICIVTIGWYLYGQYSLNKRLKTLIDELGLNVVVEFRSFKDRRLENRLYRKDYSEVFWPTSCVEEVPEICEYIEEHDYEPKYRVENGVKNQVFSRPRREEYEKIILKYGLKILGFSNQNKSVVKPLGYHQFNEFGFGSTIFSFRNCPNNNPLVFWWGDPEAPDWHPFSKWYPLLQRDTYGD